METSVASAPGWSSTGGPWVKPADAMKKLTWRTKEVTGGTVQLIRLPAHFDTPGTYQNIADGGNAEHWFQHVATLAVKLPDAERSMQEMGATVTSSGGSFTVLELTDGDFDQDLLLPLAQDGTHAWMRSRRPSWSAFRRKAVSSRSPTTISAAWTA